MYSPRRKLDAPDDFHFPYEPYDIQQSLMVALYNVLERKEIGIFESPTGTGKSLTLTCSALRWLADHEALVRGDLESRLRDVATQIARLSADSSRATDWISAQHAVTQERDQLKDLQSLYGLLQKHEEALRALRDRHAQKERPGPARSGQQGGRVHASTGNEFEEFPAGDWASEEGHSGAEEAGDDSLELETEAQRYRDVQIYFCSRTHSQLAQVVREVRRTDYGRRVRCVSLASRQQLCVHPQLRRLASNALLNERCLDMARSTKGGAAKPSHGCPFKGAQAVASLHDSALVDVLDIEELVAEGERSSACPYYAARSATPLAQLVMLPYQVLLHRRTRIQSGIDLRGAVIIIDEAHNLLDTIAQLHSCELSLKQLLLAQQQIQAYKLRYAKRFSTANLLRINQLLFIAKRMAKLLQPTGVPGKGVREASTRVLRTYELSAEGEFYNIDIFELLAFCERSRFAQKLQGFAQRNSCEPQPKENRAPTVTATVGLLQRLQQEHAETKRKRGTKANAAAEEGIASEGESAAKTPAISTTASPIRPLLAFLETLTEDAADGRVLVTAQTAAGGNPPAMLKYILLNPGGHFEEIVRDARAIIAAGGTMRPTAELTEQLFHSSPDRVRLHFYDHVVPADAVLPFAVAKGPRGGRLCFNFTQRHSKEMITELGMMLANICSVVPAGLICFFPSYDYLEQVHAQLQGSDILARISKAKRIFRESRGDSVDQLLASYTAAIQANQGALLFSVVGGKLSEGLNFADDLGRGVVVVGMPYPNRHSPELRERMNYLDATLQSGAGNEYYENLCMKAVNQCIGRSVRHIGDYASVFLLDERYASERIQCKLPQWIARSLQTPHSFGSMQAATAKFFKQKR